MYRISASKLTDYDNFLTGKWGMNEEKLIKRLTDADKHEATYEQEFGTLIHTYMQALLTRDWLPYKEQFKLSEAKGIILPDIADNNKKILADVCAELVHKYGPHVICEQLCTVPINTQFGIVMLSYKIDINFPRHIVDIKTSGINFMADNYTNSLQGLVYMYGTEIPSLSFLHVNIDKQDYEINNAYQVFDPDVDIPEIRNTAEGIIRFSMDRNIDHFLMT